MNAEEARKIVYDRRTLNPFYIQVQAAIAKAAGEGALRLEMKLPEGKGKEQGFYLLRMEGFTVEVDKDYLIVSW